MGFEIVPAVVPDLLPHRRRAVVEGVMAEAAEGQDVFLDSQTTAGTGNVMGFWESIDRFAVNTAVIVTFPYASFHRRGYRARLSAFA